MCSALWEHFGQPHGCNSIVPICHSMGVAGAVVAAALYAQDAKPRYPLAGLIFSGLGSRRIDRSKEMTPPPGNPTPGRRIIPLEIKRLMMLSDAELNCYDPEVLKKLPGQHVSGMPEELVDLNVHWDTYWRGYADQIEVPILSALGEHDWLWEGTNEHLQEWMSCFPKSERVEGGVVAGAPHALEWWWGSHAWYVRCFGWGSEVCTSLAVKEEKAEGAKD